MTRSITSPVPLQAGAGAYGADDAGCGSIGGSSRSGADGREGRALGAADVTGGPGGTSVE
jgi:hypothetical protein